MRRRRGAASPRRRRSAQGKTKVILPLFCMAFLSSNKAVRDALARGGREKRCLVVLVPEHLVPDARAQVYRYCLSLNFRQDYRIYDDIFALLHDDVRLDEGLRRTSAYSRSLATGHPPKKQIFVTSFNQFKKALTYDAICRKVYPNRDRVLVLVDEVDDFLDRCRRGVRFRRSGLQARVDGVGATSRHRDAVDGAVRESTRLVREPRPCRDAVVRHRSAIWV